MKKICIIIAICLSFCLLLTGCFSNLFRLMDTVYESETSTQEAEYERKLKEVVELLDQVYVDGYDTEDLGDLLAEAAVQNTGDRWSYYISADEYASYLENSNNEYVGIGVTVQDNEEGTPGLLVIDVNPGGSAHEGGILPGDVITAVDGESAAQIGVDSISDRIKGEVGTSVKITLERDGQEMELDLVRKVIEVEVVSYENMDGIGYIKISNFQNHCAQRSIEAIEALQKENVKGLIFDLRFNPGGRKSELVELLDYLLPEGPLFRSVDYEGKESIDYSKGESFLPMQMAVLVNGDSYSAAEFFAAALQEYEWATVVGTQTVGKGNYQQTYSLSDGSAVAVSTGHYSTPNGRNLEGIGVTPDVTVDVDEELYYGIYLQSISPEEDPQLQAALEEIKNNT